MPASLAHRYFDKVRALRESSPYLLGVLMVVIFGLILASRRLEYFFFTGTLIVALLLVKRGRDFLASMLILLGICWVIVYKWASNFLKNLGTDSFAETRGFDWNEALFFLGTLRADFEPNLSIPLLILSCISAVIIYIAAGQIKIENSASRRIRPHYATALIAAVLIAMPTFWVAKSSISAIIHSSETFLAVTENFDNEAPLMNFSNRGLKLVVYIGESTSIMNMGLYGYPRETTPELSDLYRNDDKLLVFKNVFSTHTHTSPSLLEALSVGLHPQEKFLPIYARQRVSIVDILNKNNIQNFLFSNQGKTGTYNLASSVIFKNSERSFSTESEYLGNRGDELEKPADHDFFQKNLMSGYPGSAHQSSVVFLHSYAGHGNYLSNIPERFRTPVDQDFAGNPAAMVGWDASLMGAVQAYDSAIKYVDYSIMRSIEQVKHSADPVVFIYFSDHGDSAYSGRGHDSSRFMHEMLRVPFLIYFNNSARNQYPRLFAKYQRLAAQENIATLAQLPSTIIDLLGGNAAPALDSSQVIGERNQEIIPILVRKAGKAITYVNLNHATHQHADVAGINIQDMTDAQTKIFVAAKQNASQEGQVCYQRANTMGKAVRGALVASCLELDLVVQENGRLSVYHPSGKPTGLDIDDIIQVAKRNDLGLWIDGNNLRLKRNCSALAQKLQSHSPYRNNILVEFRAGAQSLNYDFISCAQTLQRQGFRTSLHVAKDKLLACNRELESGQGKAQCSDLESGLSTAVHSQLFTDFSFDHLGIAAMENIEVASQLRWNVKNLTPNAYNKIQPEKFGMSILKASDPNNR